MLESNKPLSPKLITPTIANCKCPILSIYPLNLVAAKIARLKAAEVSKKNLLGQSLLEEWFQLN